MKKHVICIQKVQCNRKNSNSADWLHSNFISLYRNYKLKYFIIMTKGTIKFLRSEGWGKLSIENSSKDVYFSNRNVKPELLDIINSKKYVNEPVTFELTDSTFKPGEKEAININLDFSLRKVGHIVDFDKDKGWGYIEDFNSKQKFFFHYSGIKREIGKENKYISIEENEPVIFSIVDTAKGKNAIEIVLIDERCYIEFFAVFKDLKSSIIELSKKCEIEEWDYIKKKTKGLPVLFSYINQTSKRVFTQNKIVIGKSSKDKIEYAYFNTGLVTPQQDEIFAYFVQNPEYIADTRWGIPHPKWYFLDFDTEYSHYRKYFSEEPEIASYFEEANIKDLIFDTTIKVRPNRDHLLKRKKRIDSDKISNLDDDGFIEAIKEAVDLALRRIKRNYKTAIPHFYDSEIQFLLPLCFKSNKGEALGALVVKKDENIYEAHTILTLDQAYNNARLLAKPDREWLNP